jgi:hypothetical protein
MVKQSKKYIVTDGELTLTFSRGTRAWDLPASPASWLLTCVRIVARASYRSAPKADETYAGE